MAEEQSVKSRTIFYETLAGWKALCRAAEDACLRSGAVRAGGGSACQPAVRQTCGLMGSLFIHLELLFDNERDNIPKPSPQSDHNSQRMFILCGQV